MDCITFRRIVYTFNFDIPITLHTIGTILNLWTIIVIFRSKLRFYSYFNFILAMSFMNLTNCIIKFARIVGYKYFDMNIYNLWKPGEYILKHVQYTTTDVTHNMSVASAVERVIRIYNPVKANNMCSYIKSIFFIFFVILFWVIVNVFIVKYNEHIHDNIYKHYILLTYTQCLPAFAMAITNLFIIFIVQQRKNVDRRCRKFRERQNKNKFRPNVHIPLLRTAISLPIFSMICNIPSYVLEMIYVDIQCHTTNYLCLWQLLLKTVHRLFGVFMFFIIYAVNKPFRSEINNGLRKIKNRHQHISNHSHRIYQQHQQQPEQQQQQQLNENQTFLSN
ncbi:hypothetical protein SNEBB_007150 [Seison nebaliae]|nr:hypothetical protein SNEBB_007150 [Seison nebaliae]